MLANKEYDKFNIFLKRYWVNEYSFSNRLVFVCVKNIFLGST